MSLGVPENPIDFFGGSNLMEMSLGILLVTFFDMVKTLPFKWRIVTNPTIGDQVWSRLESRRCNFEEFLHIWFGNPWEPCMVYLPTFTIKINQL